jgi:copper(I)-binding protein
MFRTTIASLFAAAFLVPAAALAAGPIHVDAAWARASAGMTGAVYLTVKNDGDTPDKLLAVRAAPADSAALHEMKMDGEVMKMRPVLDLTVPAHGSVTLKPGGYHVMLMGLKERLKKGDSFPVTLIFEKAGDITAQVAVLGVGAMGPEAMERGGAGMNMGGGSMGSGGMSMPMGDHGAPSH